ncbi:Transmembrane protein 97 [Phlyctochytrium bullatum]|nr:Transmembrane protein 97 [Phlyctochytrium bullatum]
MSRPFSQRPLDALFFFYFVIHIPITLLIDIQPFLPQDWYPLAVKDALKMHVDLAGDFLMGKPPTWFASIIACEGLIQFPFFFYAAYGLWKDSPAIRLPSVAYSAHVLTTMVPIVASFLFSGDLQTPQQRAVSMSIYGPWVVIPLLYFYQMTFGFEAWRRGAAETLEKGKKNK